MRQRKKQTRIGMDGRKTPRTKERKKESDEERKTVRKRGKGMA
jgi:hypothetical protein